MKRFLFLLAFSLNLQIIVTYNEIKIVSPSRSYAQHMTREAGDNCYDEEYKIWYHSPLSDCGDPVVTPNGNYFQCPYCHKQFTNMYTYYDHISQCNYNNTSNGNTSSGGGGGGSGNGANGMTGTNIGNGINEDCRIENVSSGNSFSLITSLPVSPTTPVGCPAAAMAGYSYHNDNESTFDANLDGWSVEDSVKARFEAQGVVFEIPLIGYKSELFVKRNGEEIVGYALAFAGTDVADPLSFLADGLTDLDNFVGRASTQYQTAYMLSTKMSELVGNKELTFIGHSLGGGLAALASMMTGRVAITFNPAAVSNTYVELLRLQGINYGTSNIYGYVMEGDYVTIVQNFFGIYAQGNFIMVGNTTGGDSHSILNMMENLK